MPRRSPKTRKTLEGHCKRRISERFGLSYSQIMRDTLLSKVHNGDFTVVQVQSNRVRVYDIEYTLHRNDIGDSVTYKVGDTIVVRCVYDKQRGTFSTFLTTDMDPKELERFDPASEDLSD